MRLKLSITTNVVEAFSITDPREASCANLTNESEKSVPTNCEKVRPQEARLFFFSLIESVARTNFPSALDCHYRLKSRDLDAGCRRILVDGFIHRLTDPGGAY